MTSLNLISHVCETRKFVMAILDWKQGLLCDKWHISILVPLSVILCILLTGIILINWLYHILYTYGIYNLSHVLMRVLLGSVVKWWTHNQGVPGSSHTGSSGFLVGVSLGKTLQSPSLVQVKPRKDMKNVSCRRDMTEIPLKAPLNQSINHMFRCMPYENGA